MARVTVEDCIKKIPNRFDLVVAAAQRSREISNGVSIEIDRDNYKNDDAWIVTAYHAWYDESEKCSIRN